MEERNKKKREERQATFGLSIVVMLIVILILVGSILVLKLRSTYSVDYVYICAGILRTLFTYYME